MKNVQTILLGLVIVLGVIYVGYNEKRIADADDSHTHKGTVAMVNLNKEELLTVKKRVAYFEGVSASLIANISKSSNYHCHRIPTGYDTYQDVCD